MLPSIVSLFCGCSGSDLGFSKEGFQILFCNEKAKAPCDTYEVNFGIRPFDTPLEFIPDSFFTFRPGIVIGGPPCQSFSNGRSSGRAGGYRSCDGLTHVRQFQRVVRICKPPLLICENAPTLLQPSMDAIRMAFIEGFEDYKVDAYLLNAEDYGIPQHRERTFFLGIRKELYDKGLRFRRPAGDHWKYKYTGWADFLDIDIPPTGVWYHARSSSIKGFGPDKPTTTVMSQETPVVRYKQPIKTRKILALEREASGLNQRYITTAEMAKLQGFPSDYEFVGSTDRIIEMIGNAWNVNVARALAKEAKRILEIL